MFKSYKEVMEFYSENLLKFQPVGSSIQVNGSAREILNAEFKMNLPEISLVKVSHDTHVKINLKGQGTDFMVSCLPDAAKISIK